MYLRWEHSEFSEHWKLSLSFQVRLSLNTKADPLTLSFLLTIIIITIMILAILKKKKIGENHFLIYFSSKIIKNGTNTFLIGFAVSSRALQSVCTLFCPGSALVSKAAFVFKEK